MARRSCSSQSRPVSLPPGAARYRGRRADEHDAEVGRGAREMAD